MPPNRVAAVAPELCPARSVPEGSLPTAANDAPDPARVRDRYQELARRVAAKRLADCNAALERELEGGPPADVALDLMQLSDVATGLRRKRADSVENDFHHRPKKNTKASEPVTWDGKQLGTLQKFEVAHRRYHKATRMRPEQVVDISATYLRDIPQLKWANRSENEPKLSWEEFIEWCRNLITDPTIRGAHAMLMLKQCAQKPDQSVRDFMDYVERLEQDIPPDWSKDVIDACNFLNMLRPEIRSEVLRELKTIENRTQVIASAIRQEEYIKQRNEQIRKEPRDAHPTHARGVRGDGNRRGLSFRGRVPPRGSREGPKKS